MSVLLILQRKLTIEMGHEPGQIRSIAQLSPAERIHIITRKDLCQLPASAQPDARLDRVQVHYVLESMRMFKKSRDLYALIKLEADILGNIAEQSAATSKDILVIPTASRYDLLVAIELAKTNCPKIVMRVLTVAILNDLTTDEHDALRIHQNEGRIHLSCETEEMCEAVQDQFALQCPADFVLPCTVLPSDKVPEKVRGASFRIGVLGGPRDEKGSLRIASIVRSVTAQQRELRHPPKVTFVVQVKNKLRKRTIFIIVPLFFAALTNRNLKLEIVWGSQSGQEYRNKLFGLDCVLLPYTLERYSTSGSGMIIDAINALVPIIRTRGMSMSKAMSYGNGLEATSDVEFAAAILKMAVNPDPFIAATQRAQLAMQARATQLPFR